MWDNAKPYEVYTVGKNQVIKIGVIGLCTAYTITFTATDLSNYNFDNYYEVTKRWADFLRNEKNVDSVILLTHFGPRCPMESVEKMKLKIRNKEFPQKEYEPDQEIMAFLKKNRK